MKLVNSQDMPLPRFAQEETDRSKELQDARLFLVLSHFVRFFLLSEILNDELAYGAPSFGFPTKIRTGTGFSNVSVNPRDSRDRAF